MAILVKNQNRKFFAARRVGENAGQKELGHVLVAVFIGCLVLFGLQPTNGLTLLGVRLLAVIAPTIYLWLFVNTHWVSLLFLGLLSLTGIMSPNEIWAASMGHFAIMLILTFSILSVSLQENGVTLKLAYWFISRPWVRGRPYRFMAMFFASNLVLGLFMQNLALAVIYVGLTAKLCDMLGLKKGEALYTCLMLGTFWGNSVLSIASPIAKTLPNILIGLVDTHFGLTISYGQWLAVGIPFSIGMFGIILLVIRLANPDTTALKTFNPETLAEMNQPLSVKGRLSLYCLIGLICFIVLPDVLFMLGVLESLGTAIASIGVIVPAIFTLAVMSVLRVNVDGDFQPVLDFTTVTTKVPINVLLFVAAVVVMGGPLARDEIGVITWLNGLLAPLSAYLSPLLLFAALLFVAVLLTNFISNTVVIMLFVPLGIAMFGTGRLSGVIFAVVVAFAASITTLTPSATITAPLFFGPKHLDVSKAFKMNVLFIGFSFVFLVALIPLFVGIFGGLL